MKASCHPGPAITSRGAPFSTVKPVIVTPGASRRPFPATAPGGDAPAPAKRKRTGGRMSGSIAPRPSYRQHPLRHATKEGTRLRPTQIAVACGSDFQSANSTDAARRSSTASVFLVTAPNSSISNPANGLSKMSKAIRTASLSAEKENHRSRVHSENSGNITTKPKGGI